jgi:transposase
MVDALGNPTGFHLTPGQAQDLHGADVLLADTPAPIVIADQAYDAQARLIENFFARLKPYRAIATRDDKTARNLLRAIHLAAAIVWLA